MNCFVDEMSISLLAEMSGEILCHCVTPTHAKLLLFMLLLLSFDCYDNLTLFSVLFPL